MNTSSSNSHRSRGTTAVAMAAVCLAVAALALLGGAFRAHRGSSDDPPTAAGTTTEPSSSSRGAISKPAALDVGPAIADDAAADATTAIEPTGAHDQVGAVEVFVSYATWVVAAPAAAADPLHAPAALGGHLNTGDAAIIQAIDRTADLDFVPSEGAYRVLGYSGSETAPDQVMLEIVAPMSVDGEIEWHKLGGVIAWRDGRWAPTSMQPGEVAQPSDPSLALGDLPQAERTRMLDGLGWQLFGNTPSHG